MKRIHPYFYLSVVLLPVVALGLYALVVFVFLSLAGELDENVEAVRKIREEGFVYGPALSTAGNDFKMVLAREAKADIAIVGSSRSLYFREYAFRNPDDFVNIGGGLGNIVHVAYASEKLIEAHAPKILLIEADPWWFSGGVSINHRDTPMYTVSKTYLSREKISRVTDWVRSGKIPWSSVWGLMFSDLPQNEYTKFKAIGISGKMMGEGMYRDGSYMDSSVYFGHPDRVDLDYQFSIGLNALDHGHWHMLWRQEYSEEAVHELLLSVKKIKSVGVLPIVFFPPFPPTVYSKITKMADKYSYIPKLVARLKTELSQLDVPFFDFNDPAAVGTVDCEFVDSLHAGDNSSLKMLAKMGETVPELKRYLREDLAGFIKQNEGLAFVSPFPPELTPKKEIDFLGIGCKK